MSDKVLIARELLEFIAANARGVEREQMDKLRALLTAQPQASAAQSAPAGEREAWMPSPDEIHQMAFEEGQPAENGDGYLFCAEEFDCFVQRLLDSLAAWQRTQSAGVPEGWRQVPDETDAGGINPRYEGCYEGETKEQSVMRRAAYCLSESGRHYVSSRETIKISEELQLLLSAAPAQPAAHDQGEVQRK